ncbi:hypothetical protein M0R45_021089 [Rubus argutus]|uniref:Uncharacterized protein n=1 Tax=Rubus argutus TaxID=59490 RepID=A0AAW1XBM1_RUBAR
MSSGYNKLSLLALFSAYQHYCYAAPLIWLAIEGYDVVVRRRFMASPMWAPGLSFGGAFPGATSFPQVITTAASSISHYGKKSGHVVSDEARAIVQWRPKPVDILEPLT